MDGVAAALPPNRSPMPAEAPTTSPDIVGHNDRRLTTERKDQVPGGGHEITAQGDSAVLALQARETKAGGGVCAILLPSKIMINGATSCSDVGKWGTPHLPT
ncbi:hypothetical protein M514_02041 [Trichuris suis]|uniref:Uncharacterized protein n=1 Tax=Trichuris suis TaxID=68888 RepID=A0A085N2A6_9BILA|nr:hypothetical protein M513_02041 [Trichuris suis]KFD63602.1 hypothetical protein M514_02041 [Trichuris suis]